jgi:type VI secretion system protein ImpA
MASAEVLEFEKLLNDISEESPAGPPLRDDVDLSAKFYEIRTARNEARTAERAYRDYQTMSEDEKELEGRPDSPDWHVVSSAAMTILEENSKDIWIAAWAVEALVRQHGFAGLRDGFRLIRELCDRFWDGLHPRPDDEDGLQLTLSQVASLNDILLEPINQIPLTSQGLTSVDYIEAAALEKNADTKSSVQAAGGTTLESFERAASEGTTEYFQELLGDIEQTLKELKQLDALLEERCDQAEQSDAAPPLSRVIEAVGECGHRVRSFAKALLDVSDEGDENAEQTEEDLEAESGGVRTTSTPSVIRSREEAFLAMRKIADFFRRTEPHSPVSYALEQVVRWGGMSLPDLMKDLINDDAVRRELFLRTGIGDQDSD